MINPKRATLPRALLAALTFHVNWLETKVSYLPANWDVLWSLSVEEAFYLIYPLLCRYLKPRYLIGIAAALIVAGPFFRSVLAPNEIGSDYAYFANMDCIAFGCIAAVIASRVKVRTQLAGWIMLTVIVLARNRVFPRFVFKSGLDVTLFAIAAALIVLGARPDRLRFTWPLQWFGRNSYEVYLTHSFIVILGTQWFNARHIPINAAPAWFAGSLIIAGLLGFAVARWYSEPLNRYLRNFRKKPLLSAAVSVYPHYL